jgi:hypothetical protein
VVVIENGGSGDFALGWWVGLNLTDPYPTSVAVDDLDGDGDRDLAVALNGLGYIGYSDSGVAVLENNGDGTFATLVRHDAGAGPQSVAIGDLDGDGDRDLAVANSEDDNCRC